MFRELFEFLSNYFNKLLEEDVKILKFFVCFILGVAILSIVLYNLFGIIGSMFTIALSYSVLAIIIIAIIS